MAGEFFDVLAELEGKRVEHTIELKAKNLDLQQREKGPNMFS